METTSYKAVDNLEITHPPADEGHHVVFNPGTGRYLRVGADTAALLEALRTRSSVADLEQQLGPRFTSEQIRPALSRFRELGLLEEPGAPAPAQSRSPGRWHLDSMFSVRCRLLNPERHFERLSPMIRRLWGPWAGAASALIVVSGMAGLAVRRDEVGNVLARPLSLSVLVWSLLMVVVLTMLHELAHATLATYHGARVRSMGFLLFYFAPALFCDVSDTWRLPSRLQRAAVAFAGIWFQLVASGMGFLVFWVAGTSLPPGLASVIVVTASLNGVAAALNLVPFVKFDGYLVLMNLTDRPNLRPKAMRDAGTFARWVVLGGQRPRFALRHPVASVAYGILCGLFAPLLAAATLLRYQASLLSLGPVGAVSWLLLVAVAAMALFSAAVRRLVRFRRSAPLRPTRAAFGVLAASAAVLVAGNSISVRTVESGAFAVYGAAGEAVSGGPHHTDDHAHTVIAYAPAAPARQIRPGTKVTFRTSGVLFSNKVAEGVVTSRRGTVSVPAALSSLIEDHPKEHVEMVAFDVAVGHLHTDSHEHGVARFEVGRSSAWEWLFDSWIQRAVLRVTP